MTDVTAEAGSVAAVDVPAPATAQQYQPTTLHERERYDTDLDEAEDVLDVVDVWLALHMDGSRRRRLPQD